MGDAQNGSWAKVLIDDVKLVDKYGSPLSISRHNVTHADLQAPSKILTNRAVHVKEDPHSIQIPAGFEHHPTSRLSVDKTSKTGIFAVVASIGAVVAVVAGLMIQQRRKSMSSSMRTTLRPLPSPRDGP